MWRYIKMMKKYHKTAQRAAIMQYLKNNRHHPNIIDIYNNVSKKLSTISMTTVYNTVDLLKKDGLLNELPARNDEGRRYDSNTSPHDHLICSICGTIIDIEIDVDRSLLLKDEQQKGFDIKEVCFNVLGVCPNCKKNVGKLDS
jgi:Fur family transcriptional regulator, peroxide stress response regulator